MICDRETLVPIRVDGRFRIKELLGSGTYGTILLPLPPTAQISQQTKLHKLVGHVYRAVNIFTNRSYAIKLELSINRGSSLEHKYEVLKFLGGSDGIPRIHWFGREANYDVLVLDLLGPSLHDLMSRHKKFHIHTVAYITDRLVIFVN
ncbi:hypothetical protein JVT61DRAFT_14588 [Boletus reticuloceps]|uniref:Protein kinase domain-containing protein n=1 Tax=Boletus reticuloceps TaxID=495285 RepID=A0A8I2YR88_9AGAM|nr:hypothetical protein JVT61DRAFT_14588 [Boletus reticuloceps]